MRPSAVLISQGDSPEAVEPLNRHIPRFTNRGTGLIENTTQHDRPHRGRRHEAMDTDSLGQAAQQEQQG